MVAWWWLLIAIIITAIAAYNFGFKDGVEHEKIKRKDLQ